MSIFAGKRRNGTSNGQPKIPPVPPRTYKVPPLPPRGIPLGEYTAGVVEKYFLGHPALHLLRRGECVKWKLAQSGHMNRSCGWVGSGHGLQVLIEFENF